MNLSKDAQINYSEEPVDLDDRYKGIEQAMEMMNNLRVHGTIDAPKYDEFGDRMKAHEKEYTSKKVSPPDILCVRIDGKGFSKFTKNFEKPFDSRLTQIMSATMMSLVKETHANIGYTQSDEITLIYTPGEKASEYIFGGKVSKINSVLASMTTAFFAGHLHDTLWLTRPLDKPALFDCRAWSVPTLIEASNVLLWRAQDAKKNSVSSLFRWTAGHKAMNNLDQSAMKAYLLEKHAVDWNNLENKWKYGTYAKPVTIVTSLTEDELSHIPKNKHPKDNKVTRTQIKPIDVGYMGDLSLEERISLLN